MAADNQDYVNLLSVVKKIMGQWPLILISIVGLSALAFIHLLTTPKSYEVIATLQLKDQSLSDKGIGNEKFISGLELLEGNSELEDEIGILSSIQMVEKVLDELDFTVSLFSFSNRFNFLGEKMADEVYRGPIEIHLAGSEQLMHVPIHLEFVDSLRVRITVDEEEVWVMDVATQEAISNEPIIQIDTVFNWEEGYRSDWLSFDFLIDPEYEITNGEKYFMVINTRESLIKQYSGKLNISTISKESNIVSLKSIGRTPEKEIDFINTLMRIYIDSDLQKKSQLGLKTIEFIDRQLSSIYDSLVNVESNLETFRSSNRIIDIGKTSTELTDQLQKLEEEGAELKVQREYYLYVLNQLKASRDLGEASTSSVGVNNPFLNSLLSELSALNKEKIDKSYSSKANSPVIRVLDQKIANTRQLIIDNVDNLIKSTNIALNDNRRRSNRLQGRINTLPKSERNLVNIERKFTLNDNIYNYLLQKRAEASIALASNLPDKAIIDYARKKSKKPVSPNSKMIFGIACFLGLALPLVVLVIKDFANTTVRSEAEVSRLVGKKPIQTIGHIKSKHIFKQVKNGKSIPTSDFRFLAVNLSNQYPVKDNKVIGLSSPERKGGTTLCAYNLAQTFANFEKNTLFIDLNFHASKKPFYPQALVSGEGLSEYLLSESKSPSDIKFTQSGDYLHLFPAGRSYEGVNDFSNVYRSAIEELLTYAKKNFDVIIIDTSPITEYVDYMSLIDFFDVKVLVARSNKVSQHKLKEANELLLDNSYSVEIVLNDQT